MNRYVIFIKLDTNYYTLTEFIVGWKNAFYTYNQLRERFPKEKLIVMQYKVGEL